jgi:hypothetical protein
MKAPRARRLAGLGLAAALLAALPAARAARDRQFFSSRAGVGIQAPLGWTLSLHTGYPRLLCLLLHPSGSRISLAVDDAVTAPDARTLVEQTRPALAAQGLEVTAIGPGPHGAVQVDARAPRHDQRVRQLYFVRAVPWGRQAVVLTVTAPAPDAAAALAALEWVAARLDLRAPVRPDDTAARPDGGG